MINAEILNKLKAVTEEEKNILNGNNDIDRSLYNDNGGNVINSKKMLKNGELIAVRPHTRFVHFPVHSHDYVEVIYMCSGKTTHVIDGETVELNEGELLFLCQSVKQEIFPAGEDDIAVNFIILPEFFDRTLQMIENRDAPLCRFVLDCLQNTGDGPKYLHFEVSDILPVKNLIENLIWTLICEKEDAGNINQFTMGLLILHLINCTDILISGNDEENIVKILQYVEKNYKNGSLAELAEILHYDVSTLSREIKIKTGKNYTDLVQEKRLSKACFLLKNTRLSTEDIAERIGYENISFFHRLFKRKYGLTPRKYRLK